MKKLPKLLHVLLLTALLAFSSLCGPAAEPTESPYLLAAQKRQQQDEILDMNAKELIGIWEGEFHVSTSDTTFVRDEVKLNIIGTTYIKRFLISMESVGDLYFRPNDWNFVENDLVFSVNDEPWLATVTVHFENNYETLVGTYEQYGKQKEIVFTKVSDTPIEDPNTDFIFEGETEDHWLQLLTDYPSYQADGQTLSFTYELGDWDKGGGAIATAYGIPDLIAGMTDDVEIMTTLLNLVCDNFRHDGDAAIPEDTTLNPQETIDFCLAYGGIECRGLSNILSQMLRTCGIPAKPIMCIPATEPSEDCHVVVHAYSSQLGQWIMLDPTYRLILQTEDGQYVNLPMLRDALINGTTLIPNDNAGHNRMPFDMDFYRAYMAKNTFRFSCPSHFAFDAASDTSQNPVYMLTPAGWTVPYRWSRPERVTTDADAFWAAPVL